MTFSPIHFSMSSVVFFIQLIFSHSYGLYIAGVLSDFTRRHKLTANIQFFDSKTHADNPSTIDLWVVGRGVVLQMYLSTFHVEHKDPNYNAPSTESWH